MKAMVTGGAGFIGSQLVAYLCDQGWDVLVVDNLSSGRREGVPKSARFLWLDLTRDDAILELPDEPFDIVFHLASHVGQEISFDHPIYDFKANGQSTVSLLKWCKKTNTTRFIFASSMNIYGEPEFLPVTEAEKIKPPSPYAVGKISSEYLCLIYQNFGINSTCLRLFNVYGPGQDFDNLAQGMLRIYMSYVAKGEPILVRGSTERFRDFVYVSDVVEAFYLCAINDVSIGKIYNIATGVKTTVSEAINKIAFAFGYSSDKDYPVIIADPTRQDQFGIYGDSTLIQKELNWRPKINLDQGLKMMVAWIFKMKLCNSSRKEE